MYQKYGVSFIKNAACLTLGPGQNPQPLNVIVIIARGTIGKGARRLKDKGIKSGHGERERCARNTRVVGTTRRLQSWWRFGIVADRACIGILAGGPGNSIAVCLRVAKVGGDGQRRTDEDGDDHGNNDNLLHGSHGGRGGEWVVSHSVFWMCFVLFWMC